MRALFTTQLAGMRRTWCANSMAAVSPWTFHALAALVTACPKSTPQTMCTTACFGHLRPARPLWLPSVGPAAPAARTLREWRLSSFKISPMQSIDLRPCPFCAKTRLTVATLDYEHTQFIVVTCSACGAMGPRANITDPTGHAEFLWNQRFGMVLSISPSHRA